MNRMGTPVDASALIYLAKAKGLPAANAALGPLLVPSAVWAEVVIAGARRGNREVDDVRTAEGSGQVRHVELPAGVRKRAAGIASRLGLGAGESEVLAMGRDHGLVLLDEYRATRAGKSLGVITLETLLVPALCVQSRVLDAPAAVTLLHEIARHTTVRAEMVLRVERLIEEARR